VDRDNPQSNRRHIYACDRGVERERVSKQDICRKPKMAKRKGQRNIIGKIRVMIRQVLGPVFIFEKLSSTREMLGCRETIALAVSHKPRHAVVVFQLISSFVALKPYSLYSP